MNPGNGPRLRVLAVAVAVLLVAGGAGVATHGGPGRPAPRATTATAQAGGAAGQPGSPTSVIRPAAATATVPPGRPPGSAALEAGLVTPTDMGGYYRVVPQATTDLLAAAPCLTVLDDGPGQGGRALTGLLGPDDHSVPAIYEVVLSFPGAGAASAFRALAAAVASCRGFAFGFGGATVHASLRTESIPPVGDDDRAWTGSFGAFGASFTVQIGAVLVGHELLALAWVDTVPSSDPVMGSFASTVSLAIGKEA